MKIEDFLPWMQYVIVPVMGYGVYIIAELRRENRKLGDRVIKLEEFKESHDRWCGERNDKNEREHGEMVADIRGNIKGIQTLRSDTWNMFLQIATKNKEV